MKDQDTQDKEGCVKKCILSRRQFLLSGGIATATIFLGLPGFGTREVQAVVTEYPRTRIGKLSALKQDVPVAFEYPSKEFKNILIKLGVPAGGGVGPMKDVVAFNPVCTHMGGPLDKAYHPEYKILGQCPFHQSTFDLTRHGMIISGHATESLPQIQLDAEGDDIYATAIIGLVFGRHSNL